MNDHVTASSDRPSARSETELHRVGLEIEFLGPSPRRAAQNLARDLGGALSEIDPHAFAIHGTAFGDMLVETDLRHVHPQRYPELDWKLGRRASSWLGTLVSPFIPRELIGPPVHRHRLPEFDTVLDSLRSAGAHGQGTAFTESLGLHFNIEPPDLTSRTIVSLLKAFLVESDRLRGEISRGRGRLVRVLPPDYPRSYKMRVLDRDYRPERDMLIDDYLTFNPTRQRALDLLPLFAHFDERKVRALLPREKIGLRPVLHYRLPLSRIGDPTWSIMPDWERWLSVERLAACPLELASRSQALRAKLAAGG